MCLLALLYRVVEDAPLVVGANREEFYQRGGEPPRIGDSRGMRILSGLDPVAGGTWFGLNAHGVIVAVTNRRKSGVPVNPPSRGLLTRDLLGCSSANEAVRRCVAALERDDYAGCNFLCADAQEAVVVHAGDWLRVRPLPPGIHVLSNRDVNDATDVRAVYAGLWLSRLRYTQPEQAVASLKELCSSTDPAGGPVCFRDESRGTVCSTIVAVPPDLTAGTFLHAQGAPDRVPYAEGGHLLRQLVANG